MINFTESFMDCCFDGQLLVSPATDWTNSLIWLAGLYGSVYLWSWVQSARLCFTPETGAVSLRP